MSTPPAPRRSRWARSSGRLGRLTSLSCAPCARSTSSAARRQASTAGSRPLSKNSLSSPTRSPCSGRSSPAQVVRHRRVDAGRVALIEARHGTEQQCAVLGAAGDHAGLIETGGEGHHAKARHPPVGGLDPGDTAQRSRLADRAAGVGAGGRRHQARGYGGGRAARGSPGHAGRVPGIAHRAKVTGLIRRAHGELVHVGLAEQHGPGRPQARHHGGVVGRDEVGQHPGPAGGARRRRYRTRSLWAIGHAGQRRRVSRGQQAVGRRGRGQRRLGFDADKGIERRLRRARCARAGCGSVRWPRICAAADPRSAESLFPYACRPTR